MVTIPTIPNYIPVCNWHYPQDYQCKVRNLKNKKKANAKKSTVEHQSITARLHFNQGLCVGHPRSAGSHAHPLSPLRISAWSAERDTVYLQECRLTLVAGIGNRMDCDFMGLCPHLIASTLSLFQSCSCNTNKCIQMPRSFSCFVMV